MSYVSLCVYLLYFIGIMCHTCHTYYISQEFQNSFFNVLKKYTTVKDKKFLARLNQFEKFCKFDINKYLWVTLTSLIIKK